MIMTRVINYILIFILCVEIVIFYEKIFFYSNDMVMYFENSII